MQVYSSDGKTEEGLRCKKDENGDLPGKIVCSMGMSEMPMTTLHLYSLGASFGKNVSVPTMLPTLKAARVIALTVTFLVCPAVLLAL